MAHDVSIVMYHYIRDFQRTRFPKIKGLDVAGFRRQLDHLETQFNIVRMEEVIAATTGEPLPERAALLTFDDGYAEHYDIVFPILHERGLQGAFFPPVAPVVDGTLLDVNRVHFILASVDDVAPLGRAIDEAVNEASAQSEVETVDSYRSQWAHANRFDDAETIYVKRMLQTALPEGLRSAVAASLFERFVTSDEAAFASELYLSADQARLMVDCGMHFGSHGRSHYWLNHIDDATRRSEIDGSLEFLRSIGMPVDDQWVMCYPFGGWDDALVALLRDRRCALGLTTRVATARIGHDDPLTLPRYDTNDFPQ
jgi:peptidoglycan/xylan/chitin deacetylase (PgdA/CDA1 family)